jgi:hypothetical protein
MQDLFWVHYGCLTVTLTVENKTKQAHTKKKTQNQKNDISQKNAIFKCDPFEHMMKQQTLNYLDVDVSWKTAPERPRVFDFATFKLNRRRRQQ